MGAPQFGLDNYIGAFNFKVTIDGIEVVILDWSREVIARVGRHKYPGSLFRIQFN